MELNRFLAEPGRSGLFLDRSGFFDFSLLWPVFFLFSFELSSVLYDVLDCIYLGLLDDA